MAEGKGAFEPRKGDMARWGGPGIVRSIDGCRMPGPLR